MKLCLTTLLVTTRLVNIAVSMNDNQIVSVGKYFV